MGLLERFNNSYTENLKSGCWETSGKGRGGYGKIKVFGKTMLSHRLAYELFNGPIQSGLMVCHKCDNPRCVNPKHLFLGTAKDNMSDKISKGRMLGAKKGHKHHKAKLCEWQVQEIRKMLANGETQYSIAEKFGVSQTSINNIKTGKRWGHVK